MDTAKEPGRVAFKIVKQAKTTDNPDGNLYLALENLINKYEVKTAPNFIELEGQFTNSKLSNNEDDPDEWITHLEALRACMNEVQIVGKSMKSDTDLILSSPGTGGVVVEDNLTLTLTPGVDDSATDPNAPSDGLKVYVKAPATGGTGLFFKHSSSKSGEIISRQNALLLSMLF